MGLFFEKEIEIGKQAILKALPLARAVQDEISQAATLTKLDATPVTVADFAIQALICNELDRHFPKIPIVAEEDSHALRQTENRPVLKNILRHLKAVSCDFSLDRLFESIDRGTAEPGDTFWTLDPVDGTRGFLRREQFAIALALIAEGRVQLGILGCPNLELQNSEIQSGGVIIWAGKNRKTEMFDLKNRKIKTLAVSTITDPRQFKLVQSYESSHSDKEMQLKIAGKLGLRMPPSDMDSQVKYGLVAAGLAEIYLRIPHPQSIQRKEKIWDHAAGSLIVEQAGGKASDILGREFDFSSGKAMKNNTGILATNGRSHRQVLEVISQFFS